jgi:hypothetical protein
MPVLRTHHGCPNGHSHNFCPSARELGHDLWDTRAGRKVQDY